MSSRIGMTLALAAALGACGKAAPGGSGNNAAAPAANSAAAAGTNGAGAAALNGTAAAAGKNESGAASAGGTTAMVLNPGDWEMTASTKVSGMPPEMAKLMEQARPAQHECITAQQSAKASRDMMGAKLPKGCAGAQPAIVGGRVHADMICKSLSGATMHMQLDGKFAGDAVDVTTVVTQNRGGQVSRIERHATGHRVSPTCAAATPKLPETGARGAPPPITVVPAPK